MGSGILGVSGESRIWRRAIHGTRRGVLNVGFSLGIASEGRLRAGAR